MTKIPLQIEMGRTGMYRMQMPAPAAPRLAVCSPLRLHRCSRRQRRPAAAASLQLSPADSVEHLSLLLLLQENLRRRTGRCVVSCELSTPCCYTPTPCSWVPPYIRPINSSACTSPDDRCQGIDQEAVTMSRTERAVHCSGYPSCHPPHPQGTAAGERRSAAGCAACGSPRLRCGHRLSQQCRSSKCRSAWVGCCWLWHHRHPGICQRSSCRSHLLRWHPTIE